ncbi:MAG TPA: type II secretion system F family protein [Candidatus Saccharimonadales bacterium]|jgi:type IV pilus assembly protein PilC|nr:type II secretion system F family protein [Candidatus Saccharimonadales bacterium]
MNYTYKARTRDGKTVSGNYEAPTKEALIEVLAKQGAKPLLIHEAAAEGKKSGGRKGFFKPKVKSRDLVVFTRQLSTMVSAGVPLPRALGTLGDQAENKYFKSVVAEIAKDIESGNPLGEAFAKHPGIFSDVYVNMVKAGEAGGILDDILKRLALQTEKDALIRKKIKGAMTYPIVILTITILAFFGLMVFVIPKIGKILTDLGGPNAKLPIYTRVLLGTTNFSLSNSIIHAIPGVGSIPLIGKIPNLLFIMTAVGIGIFYTLRYIRTPKGKYKFHALLLRTPILKMIITKIAISRFARTFASLASAGVGVLDALEVTGGAIGNKVIQEELDIAAKEVKNGKPLSEALGKSKHFPPIVFQMLAVGEETGQIDTILIKVADFYDDEVDTVINSLSSIIEPVMIIVLGSIVGLIAASVMGPIASLSQNVGNN